MKYFVLAIVAVILLLLFSKKQTAAKPVLVAPVTSDTNTSPGVVLTVPVTGIRPRPNLQFDLTEFVPTT